MADEREKTLQQGTGDTSAPILDYRPHGARQPQRVSDSRPLEPGEGCANMVVVFVGFLYGIFAPIAVVKAFDRSSASDTMVFIIIACVLGIPAFATLWFRRLRWGALGVLLALGAYFVIGVRSP